MDQQHQGGRNEDSSPACVGVHEGPSPAQQRLMWTGDQREPDVIPGCSDVCFLTPVGCHHLGGGH